MNRIAELYVKLVLAVGQHDGDYVDAYYGPPEWKAQADSSSLSLADIEQRANSLVMQLGETSSDATEIGQLRHAYLRKQLGSMVARVRMLQGPKLSFDDEARALYDVTPPTNTEQHFQEIVARLDDALPGRGPVPARYVSYRSQFVIPPAKVDSVFKAAIAACKQRTAHHVTLPPGESFLVEYVADKPWSGYNWYKGGYHSVIQVNTSLPIYIDRAVDLAAHEGYPGHHVYNALLERALVRDRGWLEFSVYPLFSPQSLIAEGSANYGIEIAFPGEERVAYERETLFPLAGLPAAAADEYYGIQELVRELSYAGNEAARRYLNGEIDAAAASAWLEKYALMSPAVAEQRLRFFDRYRSYVINYNYGQDLVRHYVEQAAGPNATPEARWAVFTALLASPRLPSALK
ncbi:MAG TPA: hypothetical protein VM076_14700 [Gemmatimonadaceae bacterium]|nr:hypothetical protein [Gemmatimonadaceae bacterium]